MRGQRERCRRPPEHRDFAMSQGEPAESFRQHEQAGKKYGSLGFAVLTFSDSRNESTDTSGQCAREAIVRAGHQIVRYAVVRDDSELIRAEVEAAAADQAVAVIVTNGSTGIAARDNASEVISRLLEKRLDGFGELFRMLSYEQIGAAAMLSRAVGGILRGKVLFSLPGSTKAVQLGMEKLIVPQASHIYFELHKHQG